MKYKNLIRSKISHYSLINKIISFCDMEKLYIVEKKKTQGVPEFNVNPKRGDSTNIVTINKEI